MRNRAWSWRGIGVVIWLALLTGLTLWFGWMRVVGQSDSASSPLRCQQVLAPAYYWLDANYVPMWQRLTNSGISGQIIVAGLAFPATAPDPTFVSVIHSAQAKGIRVLGYVQTAYGSRDLHAIEAQIRDYQNWYGLDGVFIDEVIPDMDHLAYYQTLATAVRARPGQLVVLNPGGIPNRAYMRIADIIVVFDGSFRAYEHYQFPTWIFNYPAGRFAQLIHTTAKPSDMEHALALSRTRNAGYVYVTDDTGANAYHLLPSYWTDETNVIEQSCGDGAITMNSSDLEMERPMTDSLQWSVSPGFNSRGPLLNVIVPNRVLLNKPRWRAWFRLPLTAELSAQLGQIATPAPILVRRLLSLDGVTRVQLRSPHHMVLQLRAKEDAAAVEAALGPLLQQVLIGKGLVTDQIV